MPEDNVLEPLFHRQVKKCKALQHDMKKCKALQHDIAIYERAAEGSSERSFKFLYDASTSHLNRKRLERNRERIAKQTGALLFLQRTQRVLHFFCQEWQLQERLQL